MLNQQFDQINSKGEISKLITLGKAVEDFQFFQYEICW